MNTRQKAGVTLGISGFITLVVGIFALSTPDTPAWIQTLVNILSTTLPLVGLMVNLPSNTNPR